MPTILTRRSFIGTATRLALTTAGAACLNVPTFLYRALADGGVPTHNKKVLFIFLRGGNDGLNMVIPWADDAYSRANRPNLYLPPPDPLTSVPGQMPLTPDLTRVIDLGNQFAGLHPSLGSVSPLFNAGQLAVIHRVGYSKQSRSHFDSQRYWENAAPRETLTSGVLYRAVVDTGLYLGRRFPAISVQSSTPLMLRGPMALPNLSDPSRFDLLGVANSTTVNGRRADADKAKLLHEITEAYGTPHPLKDNRSLVLNTGQGLESAIEQLKTVGLESNDFYDTDGTTHLFPIDSASNQKGFSSGAYGFFRNLKTAVQILASTDAVAAGTQLDGFDTHNAQGTLTGTHANLLRYVGWAFYAVRKFMTDINPQLWNDTIVATLSEFGRTSKENGSAGTDHAEAGVMFVAGGALRGGVYQCSADTWTPGPSGSMFQASKRYLQRSVDYRSVFGEIVRKHLGVSEAQLAQVVPGYANETTEHLRSGGTAPDGTRIVGELGLL